MKPRSGARWIEAVALSCFLAGIAVGLAVPVLLTIVSGQTAIDPDEEYVRKLADRYSLTDEQAHEVRCVLAKREIEHRQILSDVQSLPPDIKKEVLGANRRCDERLKIVLNPEQRERFLHDTGR